MKPTFLRVGVPKNTVRPPTTVRSPDTAGTAGSVDPPILGNDTGSLEFMAWLGLELDASAVPTFKGLYVTDRTNNVGDSYAMPVNIASATLSSTINGAANGNTIDAGDIILVMISNKFTGTGYQTFNDLLSYDSGLTLAKQQHVQGGSNPLNLHTFIRTATASESNLTVTLDTNPGAGTYGIILVFTDVTGIGNTHEIVSGTSIANGADWDPLTDGSPLTVLNQLAVVGWGITFDDDAAPGITTPDNRGFTDLGTDRTQDTVNDGQMRLFWRQFTAALATGDHTHTLASGDFTDVDVTGVTVGDMLRFDGTDWVPA